MKRGDLVTVVTQGDFGKPRPALIIQADQFNAAHATITVMLISSEIVASPIFRLTVEPDAANGLQKTCQLQADKVMTLRREKIGGVFGHLDKETMLAVNRALAVFLGIA